MRRYVRSVPVFYRDPAHRLPKRESIAVLHLELLRWHWTPSLRPRNRPPWFFLHLHCHLPQLRSRQHPVLQMRCWNRRRCSLLRRGELVPLKHFWCLLHDLKFWSPTSLGEWVIIDPQAGGISRFTWSNAALASEYFKLALTFPCPPTIMIFFDMIDMWQKVIAHAYFKLIGPASGPIIVTISNQIIRMPSEEGFDSCSISWAILLSTDAWMGTWRS